MLPLLCGALQRQPELMELQCQLHSAPVLSLDPLPTGKAGTDRWENRKEKQAVAAELGCAQSCTVQRARRSPVCLLMYPHRVRAAPPRTYVLILAS